MLGSVTMLHLAGLSVNVISITAIIFSSGVGINDAVIKAHTLIGLLKKGMDFNHALRVASQKRFMPILLTSITTLISCIVQATFTPEWDQIQLSICIAMAGGIVYSTLWAVFSMPALLKTVGWNYRIVQPMG
jgi:multidrug efflux pump subunit AcrB